MTTHLYYRHSGRIGVLGLLLMPTISVATAALLGVVYGYGLYYIPSVYLSAVLCALFGGVVGWTVGLGAIAGKVRNTWVVAAFGFAAGVFAEYAGWVSWIHAVTGGETSLDPFVLWTVAEKIAVNGAWSVFGVTPTGWALYGVWALEASVIIGAATLCAAGQGLSVPFCEKCHVWTQKHSGKLARLAEAADPSDLRLQLEQGNTSALADLGKAMLAASAYTALELAACPRCRQLNVLTVKAVTVTKDAKGGESQSEATIVDGLLLDATAVSVIRGL
jgi:hypothetical protein